MTGEIILLVEDNEDDAALTLRALEKNSISSDMVAVARNGVEALDYLFGSGQYAWRDTAQQPQLILLDLKMPKMDGIEVLRRLRQDDRTRLIPVVVLTSSDEKDDIVQIYNLGANSYIRKPVDFNEFTEAVRQLGVYWLRLNLSAPLDRDV